MAILSGIFHNILTSEYMTLIECYQCSKGLQNTMQIHGHSCFFFPVENMQKLNTFEIKFFMYFCFSLDFVIFYMNEKAQMRICKSHDYDSYICTLLHALSLCVLCDICYNNIRTLCKHTHKLHVSIIFERFPIGCIFTIYNIQENRLQSPKCHCFFYLLQYILRSRRETSDC